MGNPRLRGVGRHFCGASGSVADRNPTSGVPGDEVADWVGALALALALWIGFALVLWAGEILHERTPWKLAAIHAGDWLIKLTAVTVIVGVWQ